MNQAKILKKQLKHVERQINALYRNGSNDEKLNDKRREIQKNIRNAGQ